ncbi:MAG: aryl-sulfate sulfotransferase [Spirochaetes bacterium]|nr:aryl-sulfate sulfotransferase [Spirochaetota bacterium]
MSITVHPTGTTIYNPDRCWNGYTVFQGSLFKGERVGAVLIDMNGNVVNQWRGLDGFPNIVLPGGYIMGSIGIRNYYYGLQETVDLVQADWNGNIVWKFNKYEQVGSDKSSVWMARQHHDYQREGNPVGYYVPGMNAGTDNGNTVIITHRNLKNSRISEKTLLDDVIIEVSWDGKIVWEWICSDHFEELGFSEDTKKILASDPNMVSLENKKVGDWMHMNSVSLLGPNKRYDAGDNRFHPENLIFSGRQTDITGIIEKKSGRIVWQTGPDYSSSELQEIGSLIGPHHAHMIPTGLPGEGNILVFDNGGQSGYRRTNADYSGDLSHVFRDYSRVLEFDPVSLKVTWKLDKVSMWRNNPENFDFRFYSSHISSAQRLANGNTLITEGNIGRIFEVTPELDLVWEYVSPYKSGILNLPFVYRAYRLPYEWIPQADIPEQIAVQRPDNSTFRVPGQGPSVIRKVTEIKLK